MTDHMNTVSKNSNPLLASPSPHDRLPRWSKPRCRLYGRNDRALSIEDEGSDDLSLIHAYLDEAESMSECVGEKSQLVFPYDRARWSGAEPSKRMLGGDLMHVEDVLLRPQGVGLILHREIKVMGDK